MSSIMRTITPISTTMLLGFVSIAITSANAQGPPFGAQNGWGYGGDNNPYNSNNNGNDNGDGYGGSSGNGGASSSSFGFGINASNAGFDYTSALRYRSIHGVLAAIAFAFLFPLGSIVMRVTPSRHAWILHGFIQLLAYALYIAAAGLGLYLVSIVRIPPSGTSLLDAAATNAHPIIGIVLLSILFFQPLLGVLHHRRFKKRGTRTWVSHAHLWIGRLSITLGIINGGLGLALAGATGGPVIAYAVVGGIMWILWLLAALFGEYRRTRALKKRKENIHDDGYVRGAGVGTGARAMAWNAAAIGHGHGHGTIGAHDIAHPAAVPMAGHDVPSPPYSPGPHYEVHQAHHHQQPYRGGVHEMRNLKEVVDRSDTLSTLSSSQDAMYRGQV
ncbi:hypothetical protein HD806DRAFT_496328 [Xylariaceae sp. AK1471]|nr:hypothetical protein HD806DRAFT_496328 [Xylariaceae sp. AK1471]